MRAIWWIILLRNIQDVSRKVRTWEMSSVFFVCAANLCARQSALHFEEWTSSPWEKRKRGEEIGVSKEKEENENSSIKKHSLCSEKKRIPLMGEKVSRRITKHIVNVFLQTLEHKFQSKDKRKEFKALAYQKLKSMQLLQLWWRT